MTIAEGIYAAKHGMFKTIQELYFPELELSVNDSNGEVNILLDAKDRYKQEALYFRNSKQPMLIRKILIEGEKASAIRWMSAIRREEKSRKQIIRSILEEDL